jgi:hypothetical protein
MRRPHLTPRAQAFSDSQTDALYWGLVTSVAVARVIGFDEIRFLNLARHTWRIREMQETTDARMAHDGLSEAPLVPRGRAGL